MFKRILLVFGFLTSLITISLGQNWSTESKLGLVFDFGNPVNRFGFTLQLALLYDNDFQTNIEWKVYDQIGSFGPKNPGAESKLSIAFIYGYGKNEYYENPFYSVEQNQLKRKYALGYVYQYYKDQTNTSQGTGSLIIGIAGFQIITENDILGNLQGLDQYRTGAFGVTYRRQEHLFALKTILYTGQTRCDQMKRVQDSNYPSRFGYKDNSACQHSDCSHGILAGSYAIAGPTKHALGIGFGIDADQIRNIVQNKLIHDMYFIPSFMNSAENPHIPMLDREGKLFLYQEDQRIRLPRFFYSLSANGNMFY